MQKIIIETEKLYLEADNYVVNENNIILMGTISNDTPLSYWLRASRENEYAIRINEEQINMWIPQNDITSIIYHNETN